MEDSAADAVDVDGRDQESKAAPAAGSGPPAFVVACWDQLAVLDEDWKLVRAMEADLYGPKGLVIVHKRFAVVAAYSKLHCFEVHTGRAVSELEVKSPDWFTPAGMVASGRRLWVADRAKHCIRLVDVSEEGQLSMAGSIAHVTDTTAPAYIRQPGAMCRTPTGNLVLSDAITCFVQEFTPDGDFVKVLFPRHSETSTAVYKPIGVAFDKRGLLWVVDYSLSRIQVYDREGQHVARISTNIEGENGTSNGEGLMYHEDEDQMVLSDTSRLRLQIFQCGDAAFLQSRQLRVRTVDLAPWQPKRVVRFRGS